MTHIHWCALACLMLVGCYGSKGNTKEGQSHWLTRCGESSDCSDDQICACGVCTIACEADASCGASGACVSIGDEPSCAEAPSETPDVCLAECMNDEDCDSSDLMCSGGSCVAALEGGPALVPPSLSSPVAHNGCEGPGAYDPLEAMDGEVCYKLLAHNGDTSFSPFLVPNDESISNIYYEIPWPAGSVATRFGADLDNLEVLRQWLLFATPFGEPGTVEHNALGTVAFEDAQLLAGWGAGGCNVTLPSDMGLELPEPGSDLVLMVQWHHLNLTGAPQPDASEVQICVVPGGERSNIGGITTLGTEKLASSPGMAPNTESKFNGTCVNEASEPITIVAFRPSMHAIGTRLHSQIERAGGGIEIVFDQPFTEEYQPHYLMSPTAVLQPGDTIRTECTYFNDTPESVPFGPSITAEICFQYAYTYPAGALDKPPEVALIGATNACFGE